jgi:glycosyltransferase involved in cell wall biosynthesis
MSNFDDRMHFFEEELTKLSKLRSDEFTFLIWARIYYEIFYRLPTKKDLLEFDFEFAAGGIVGLMKHIRQSLSGNLSAENFIEFRIFPKNSIFIDVTHTINYPFNTGIQRVVRSLVAEIHKKTGVYLVRFDSRLNSWVVVTQDELKSLLFFKANSSSHRHKTILKLKFSAFADLNEIFRAFLHGLYSSYRYLISNENGLIYRRKINVERLKQKFYRIKYKARIKSSSGQQHIAPVLIDQQLVIVEPIQNPNIVNHLEFFEEIGSLSCIVYDLLPISNPEFFQNQNSFPHFLRLIRFASKVSAISDFTKKQIEKYSDLRSDCSLNVHLLPIGKRVPSSNSLKLMPTVLNVGSFEPRKNQISLIRASELLWSRGVDFQLVLVGGQGWNNKDLKHYISELISKGRNLRIYNDVSNETLEELYQQCDIVVSVPWIEGFGLPVAEGIARNKMVLASRIPSHLEFAGVQKVVFVDPGDLQSITHSLRECLAKNPNHLDSILDDFQTWTDYADNIYDFLSI